MRSWGDPFQLIASTVNQNPLKSHDPSVTWSLSHMIPQSHDPSVTCPSVTWSFSHMIPQSHDPSVTWSLSHMISQSHDPSVTWSLIHMVPESHDFWLSLGKGLYQFSYCHHMHRVPVGSGHLMRWTLSRVWVDGTVAKVGEKVQICLSVCLSICLSESLSGVSGG